MSAADQLRMFVERIERLDAEITGLRQDRREVMSEAKSQGFCIGTIGKVVKRRKMSVEDRQEADAILGTYEAALGMANDVAIPMVSEDALDEAVRLMAEQVEGMQQGALATVLRAGLTLILEERADIREINARIAQHRQNLKSQGLDAPRVMDTVRWIERCEKHGREKMLAADGTFRLYRATAEAGELDDVDTARDVALKSRFAGIVSKPEAAKVKSASAVTLLDARRFAGK